MDQIALGKRIKAAREKADMTQEDLAAAVDYSVDHMSVVERGVKSPKLEKLVAIANILGNDQQFLVRDAQHLVWSQQPSAPLSFGLAILGNDLRHGDGLAHGHGGVDLHRHITASRREISGLRSSCTEESLFTNDLRVRSFPSNPSERMGYSPTSPSTVISR